MFSIHLGNLLLSLYHAAKTKRWQNLKFWKSSNKIYLKVNIKQNHIYEQLVMLSYFEPTVHILSLVSVLCDEYDIGLNFKGSICIFKVATILISGESISYAIDFQC